jgi:predicted Zn finger-like uncharacterized protein
MLIVCPNCASTYDVSAASLGPQGRSVRCVKCQTVWHAAPTEEPAFAEAEMAMPQAEAPADAADDWAEALAEAREETPEAPADEDVALLDPGARALAMDQDEVTDDPDALADHDSPPIAPDDVPQAPVVDVETLAARRERRRVQDRHRKVKPWLFLAILAMMGLIGGILGWRVSIVQMLPQTASLFRLIGLPVNLRGLDISDVASLREVVDGVAVLVIEGKITNLTHLPHDVPRVRFALVNGSGGEVYSWTTVPTQSNMPPDGVQKFRTRLASPPAEGRAVIVRFLNRRDAAGGLK